MAKQHINWPNLLPGREQSAQFKLPLAIIVYLAILAGPIRAQQESCLNRTIAVNVLTDEGKYVEGLTPQNFRGKLQSKPIQIESATRDFAPRRVVMLLDASASMDDLWGFEIFMARRFLAVNPNTPLALITFSNQVDEKVNFSQGRKAVSDKLAQLELPVKRQGARRTALRDAVVDAMYLLHPWRPGDAIYLISDTGENASKLDDSESKRDLLRAGVRLFALVPIERSMRDRTPEEEGGPAWISGLVTATGGDSTNLVKEIDIFPSSRHDRPAATMFSKSSQQLIEYATVGFANEIEGFYRLNLKLPEPLKKPHDWELKVVDSSGKVNAHWRIIYPHQLAACP